jgi:hypothetical protein
MMLNFLLVATMLTFAGSKRFVDYLDQKTDSCGVNFIKVDSYFIGISFTLPATEKMDVTCIQTKQKTALQKKLKLMTKGIRKRGQKMRSDDFDGAHLRTVG